MQHPLQGHLYICEEFIFQNVLGIVAEDRLAKPQLINVLHNSVAWAGIAGAQARMKLILMPARVSWGYSVVIVPIGSTRRAHARMDLQKK
mmetsp:Transcript_25570/g.40978  ORF Transcript_25570/g.40978 Transcript_25570/m.40978 type:complete len:90 (-) Transcript_25570:18-287(-)